MPRIKAGHAGQPRRTVILLGLLVSAVLLAGTRPENTGDSVDWARDIAAAPSFATPSLYEAGHLLWRPIGVVLRDGLQQSTGKDAGAVREAQRTMSIVAAVGAILLTVSTGLLVLDLLGSLVASAVAMLLVALGAAVINFGQAGSPYVPGIALVTTALYVGTQHEMTWRHVRAALAGGILAAGVLLWLPYVLVVPATLVAIFLAAPGDAADRRWAVLIATGTCALVGAGAYLTAAAAQGIRNLSAFIGWVAGSSHGISRPGLSRVIIGLPRSFVHMGHDGREVRRYLLGDPLNPVTAGQLAMLPVWPKLLVFYGVLAAVMWYALRRPKGRDLLLTFIVALVPVAALGAAWSGGEEERYLSLFPFLLPLVIWSAWSAGRERHRALPVAAGAFALLWVSNVLAFNPIVSRARSEQAEARLGCVGPMLDAHSVIVVPDQADPLVTFARDRLDERPRSVGAEVVYLLPPRTIKGLSWDSTLSAVATNVYRQGGRVWVPAYVLDTIPPRAVGWVEGARPVTWRQVQGVFSALALRRPCDDTQLLEVAAMPVR